MRVLALVSRDAANPALGGGELVIDEFTKALARRGHEVDVLCASFRGAPAEADRDGVRIHRVAPESVLGLAASLEYRRRYRGRVDVILEEFLGGSRIPFSAPLYARERVISLWYQDHLPIFRHEFSPWLYPALAGLEHVLTWTHRRAEFLVDSGAARESLVAKGVDEGRIQVYHPGIDPVLLRAGPPLPARRRAARMVCLGKIRRYKCQHHAILALKQLAPAVPEATLVIAGRVGDRDYLAEMKRLADESGLREKVTFEVDVTEGRKRELLETSRVLLAPAPIEGFGIAIVEASACGLPTVGTTGVPVDSLSEGVNGFRVPFADVAALAQRASELLRDDLRFDALSVSAAGFAQSFTWERAAEPLLAMLRSSEDGPR